jgi:alkaline phosphatase
MRVKFTVKLRAIFLVMAALAAFGAGAAEGAARYVFLFIGDGMGVAQRNAAELYLAGMRASESDGVSRDAQMVMNALPVNGLARTASESGVTDSAAAATAIATGHKVKNGVISMNTALGEKYQSIADVARKMGMKVGIVTTTFLQDATPAAFYGRAPRRTDTYELGLQLVRSGFDYFGGGGFSKPGGAARKSSDLRELAAAEYLMVTDLSAPPPPGKVMAIHPGVASGYMPWVIDNAGGPSLADFVDYGIRALDNPDGFFMMVEGGKIDLACHANDAAASIRETTALDEAIARAVAFMNERPETTLIVVTSDHETGGLALDPTRASADAIYRAFGGRRGSYAAFERRMNAKKGGLQKHLDMARDFFGESITNTDELRHAFRLSSTPKDARKSVDPRYDKLYATYDPFTMACLATIDGTVGISWTTHYHTGKDIPVSAAGVGAGLFEGEYENTALFSKILSAMSDE